MGGIPTNPRGEVVTVKDGNPDTVVSGLMAIGEAACVSVHGANRLGSNSLLELVVFGRAAAKHASEVVQAGAAHKPLPNGGESAITRLDKARHASGGIATAELRLQMQRTMQNDCAVFRTRQSLDEGCARMDTVFDGRSDIRVKDRSMMWNSALVETLEFENLVLGAQAVIRSAANRTETRGRACPRGLP